MVQKSNRKSKIKYKKLKTKAADRITNPVRQNGMKQKDLTIVIVNHVYATGPSFLLERYLQPQITNLIFIGHPFAYTKDTRSFLRIYKNGELKKEIYVSFKGPELLFYVKDTLLTWYWLSQVKGYIDYVIAVDNLNAFAAYILKLLHKTKCFVFYTIDYVPNRFPNKVMNNLYHFLDRLAVRKSDAVWILSSIMVEEREKRGISSVYRNKQFAVPVGTDIASEPVPFGKVDRYKIVFLGHLREGQGVEMLLSAMKDVIKKVPKAHALVIGGGPLEKAYLAQIKKLNLTKKVKLTGFVEKYSDVKNMLKDAAIAVAPYEDDEKSYTRYTDPGKPKDYLAFGIPVVITKVPLVAFEIEKRKAGKAVDANKEDIANAITDLLSDTKKLVNYRKNAFSMAKDYRWDKIWDETLKKTMKEW